MKMEILHFMEYTCLIITLLLFATGISPCLDMYKTGDTRNVPFLIFLLSIAGCVGTAHYALMLGLTSIFVLNFIGSILNISYTLMYLLVVKNKVRPVFYTVLVMGYFVVLYYYAFMILDNEEAKVNAIGGWSSTIITVTMSIPIVELIDNFRNKNAEGMPTIMLIGGLLCGLSWFIYGMMLKDANIYAPNIPGISINLLKLFAVSLYGSPQKAKKE